MFGKNEIVGVKHFNVIVNEGNGDLLVTTIFYSFQGEGMFTGRPAVFIRLSKCNLACKMCDAFFDQGILMDPLKVLDKAYEEIRMKVPDANVSEFTRLNVGLVLTGGEPLLQMNNLLPFLKYVASKFAWIQVETNATQNISPLPRWVKVVASPKCLEKASRPGYLNPHPSILSDADCLKFVVSHLPDSPYHDIPEWAKKFKRPIYISPMNIYNRLPTLTGNPKEDEVVSFWTEGLLDKESNRLNHEYAAKLCIENGYIFNLQAHLYASMA